MTPGKKKYSLPMVILGGIIAVTAAYYSAAAMGKGRTVFVWLEEMKIILKEPCRLYFNSYTLRTAAVFLTIYVMAVLLYTASRRNYLPGKEMGSAQYADVRMVNKRLSDHHNDADDPKNIVIAAGKWRRR